MNKKIILQNGKELLGITGIIVSEVDNTIYINSSSRVENSIEGAFAIYDKDGAPSLTGSGPDCYWDKSTSTLNISQLSANVASVPKLSATDISVSRLSATDIVTETLTVPYISTPAVKTDTLEVTNYQHSLKVSVKKWLGFESLIKKENHPFKIFVRINPKNKKEFLAVLVNDTVDSVSNKSFVAIAFEDIRLYVNSIPNLAPKTIATSLGSPGDLKGDISIDENYFYYCINDHDGTSKIWKRLELNNW
jgi:hypothetical protein